MICLYSKCQKNFEPDREGHKYCTHKCGIQDRAYKNRYAIYEKRKAQRANKKAMKVLESNEMK